MFALDVTGSMGNIPHLLAKEELPNLMKLLTDCRIADPQVMFMAVGDATSDNASLQVGQFEATAELMDQWLTWSFIEGGGGGTGHERYELAFYIAAQHTDMDNWAKRKKKGYFFMTGDEPPFAQVDAEHVRAVIDPQAQTSMPLHALVAELERSFEPFFLIPDPARAARDDCAKPP